MAPDPDVVFVRRADGSFAPISFQNSLVFNQPVRWLEDGTIEVRRARAGEHRFVREHLLRNIAEQQILEPMRLEVLEWERVQGPRGRRLHSSRRLLGGELYGPFDRGRGGPGGWVILDEPELHLSGDA